MMTTRWPVSVLVMAALASTPVAAATFFVATGGSNSTGDGSAGNPWATITHAVDNASGGDEIIVRPGTYDGRQSLRQQFDSPVLVRSEIPYAARLRHDAGAALIAYTGRNIVVEGFDIAHAPSNSQGLVIQIQDLLGDFNGSNGGTDAVVSDITLRNNIIHSSTNNDLLKINNGAERIRVEGNLFFNQEGSDEHIDINSVIDVEVVDNVFMNTADRPDTSSFVVIKDSNGNDDTVLGTEDVHLHRNIFLNWFGSSGQSFVRLGEDGTSNFEAFDVLIENNLMLGNSGALIRTALTIQGSRDVLFRHNTISGDLPARSYVGRFLAGGSNPPNQDLTLVNNVFSDPTGSMGSEAFNGVDFIDAPAGQTINSVLDNNHYYNGGNPIPLDAGQAIDFSDDANASLGAPLLVDPASVVVPLWDGTRFAEGSNSIREAFERLVRCYAAPKRGSPLIDAAAPGNSPAVDILGRTRDANPDLGAFEQLPSVDGLFADRFERDACAGPA
ncbi:MAG: choice-of-anchor Q domain-containing protein [Pseudomonadota bacterium]